MAKDENCDPVPPPEVVTRFALDKSYFRISDFSARHNAFMPSDGEVSVFRISELEQAAIWEMGTREVAVPQGKELRGRLDAVTERLMSTGAIVCIDEPPMHHAV